MRERWPRLMREIAEELGDDAALKLVARYGGQEITVPRLHPRTLEAELGPEIAALMVDLHGGGQVYVPNFGAKLAEERKRFVLTHPELSANDCAQRLGLSHVRVRQIRREARPDPNQLDFFEEA